MTWATARCPDQCGCKRLSGDARQRRNAAILRDSDVCHICGEPGADAVDHVQAWATSHNDSRHNLAPAHHDVPNSRGDRCNRSKSSKAYAPIVRRSGALR